MVALYARVSTKEQAKEGYSIDEQIERLKKYCEAHGCYDYMIFVDAGYSGSNTNRPDLRKLIKEVKKGNLEKVIVYKLDRLSRSQKDTLELIEDVFLKNNVDFESMSERFDTSTSFGRAMVGILAVFAQLEREQIKERVAMGREARAKEGRWHGGGWDPIGYDYVNGNLIVNEYEAMQVRKVFELFLSGYNYTAIVRELEKNGYKYKGNSWTSVQVKRTLVNDLYIGKITFDGNSYEGLHAPILDAETFEKASSLCKKKAEKIRAKISKKQASILGGLLRCKQCGGRYAFVLSFDGKYKYHYYDCYSRRKINKSMIVDPNCTNKNWRAEELERIIFDEIKKLKTDPEYITKIRNNDEILREKENKIALLESEIDKLEKQKSRFMDLYGYGDFTRDELREKITPIKEHQEMLKKELEKVSEHGSRLDTDEVKEVVRDFEGILERGIYEEIRLVVINLIDFIELDGEEITIHWSFT